MKVSIKQLNEGDWRDFAEIRLKALQTDPMVFGSNFEKESQFTEADWKSRIISSGTAIFMLYENETPIGITGVSILREDPSGKTAIFWGSWLEPDHRGAGLSEIMYGARFDWLKSQSQVEKIIISHRASNLSSKYANQKHGFVYTHSIEKTWFDGKSEDEVYYELRIKS